MPFTQELKWTWLTGVVNHLKAPNQFLKRLLWSNEDPVPTEDIELSVIARGREIAPFVKRGAEGVMVGGATEKYQTVSAPNIRLKKPFNPSQFAFARRPGTPIHVTDDGVMLAAIQQHIVRDIGGMNDMIVNAEEYLCSMALQGVISYSDNVGDVFTITFPKPAANNITLSIFWDDADPTKVRVLANITTVKTVLADEGFTVTDAICGSEAQNQLLLLAEAGSLKFLNALNYIDSGTLTFTSQFTEDGVLYLGTLGNVRFWGYPRTATLKGTSVNMIRPKYVEFVCVTASSERVMYYGAIPDLDAFEAGAFRGKRFSKSWKVPDPSALMALVASRPLPVPRKPYSTVSMKVISG